MNTKTTIFLHIPKTAGTSFNSALSLQYAGKPSLHVNVGDRHCSELGSLPNAERSRIKLLRGHIYFGAHRLLTQPSKYITILRNPAERVLSYWRYAKLEAETAPKGGHWWTDAVRELSFREHAGSGKDVELENGQLRWILGNDKDPSPKCTQNDLERGIEILEKYFVSAGIQERFDESLALISCLLKWRRPLFFGKSHKVHANSTDSILTEDDNAWIRENNKLDTALYDYASNRLERQLAANRVEVARAKSRLELYQQYSRILEPAIKLKRQLFRH